MAIKIKYRDPKSTDFSPDDIIINVKEGTLFYKDHKNLYKLQGDQIITPLVESNITALRQVGEELTEVSASGFTTVGSVSASRFYASDGFYHSDDTAEDTYLKFPTGDKVQIVAGGVNFFRAHQVDTATDNKLYFNYDEEDMDVIFRTKQNNPGLVISGSSQVGIYGINKPSASLHVGGNVLTDSHITASGNISSSGGESTFGQVVNLEGTDPRLRLKAKGANHPGVEWYEDTTRKWVVYNDPDESDNLTFKNNSTELLKLTQGGNLGVTEEIYHIGDTNTKITFTDDDINLTTAGKTAIDITWDGTGGGDTREITFNESGEDFDVRIEGEDDANLLFTDATTPGRVGIGTKTPSKKLTVQGDISASGDLYMTINGGSF